MQQIGFFTRTASFILAMILAAVSTPLAVQVVESSFSEVEYFSLLLFLFLFSLSVVFFSIAFGFIRFSSLTYFQSILAVLFPPVLVPIFYPRENWGIEGFVFIGITSLAVFIITLIATIKRVNNSEGNN